METKVVLPLNKSPLCDAYIKRKKIQKFYDLNLTLCSNCNFVQIDTVVNPKIIYRDYIYYKDNVYNKSIIDKLYPVKK